jgi:hypothetical protein
MSDLRAAAQQALEALNWYAECAMVSDKAADAASALRAALEQPVAWLRREELADLQTCNYRRLGADSPRIWAPHQADTPTPEEGLVPVYTHPPRREWRSLSEEEIYPLYSEPSSDAEMVEFARAIEAALRSKNHE